MALKQSINADSKSQGGIVSISQRPTALHRWFLTSHEREAITTSLKIMYGRRVRKGGCTGCTCTPPPPPGKKVPLTNVQKRRESSAQICRPKRMCAFRSDTTKLKRKRLGKRRKRVKGKGLNLKNKERG